MSRDASVLALGSHVFEPGVEGNVQAGQDTSRNSARRTARLARRQIWRRRRRRAALLRALIKHGLLPAPAGALDGPERVHAYLLELDARLAREHLTSPTHADQQKLPYLLRAAAAVGSVSKEALGRAIYHLAQRRGFQSNRRADARRKDEEAGKVKEAIAELSALVSAHDPPTLGAYLASLDPDEQRIRGRWTSRALCRAEFDTIWGRQAAHLGLTEDARKEIAKVIFDQRPLKSQKHLIGRCSLVPSERRAPVCHRLSQRVRVLQTVNNLIVSEDGRPPRGLTPDERHALLAALFQKGDLSFGGVRKLLGLRGAKFNLEEGGAKKLIGHRTDGALRDVFGEAWDELSEDEKDRVVEDVRSFRLPDALERRGRARWGLSEERAKRLAEVTLEEGHAALSFAAMRRLLPLLEEGVEYGAARRQVFPESFRSSEPMDRLPPVAEAMEDLRNPAVMRALTEVRKVVNALVRRFGKPAALRVELGRELKNPRGVRERISRDNRAREAARERAKERLLREGGVTRPSREDIEKVLLADECGWICPYTGQPFGWGDLVGPTPRIDVEHIWPRSRVLDDSFLNKTLCFTDENRMRKRGRTPFEAYGSDPRWPEILDRVGRFKGDPWARAEKLRRFEAEELDPDFTNRHLSDTRFIARAAADYLGLLFGGRVDEVGSLRVQVCTGGLTAWLRTGWGLDRLLGEDGEKNRADHRHHAVDAVVVALSDARAVQALARAAGDAEKRGARRAFERVDPPRETLREEVAAALERVVVSHRQSRKVSGALHDQTNYSRPHDGSHRVRKELHKLTPSEVRDGKIVDARALRAIREKLAELGKPSPTAKEIGQIFGDPANAPLVRGADGRMVRLRKVRVSTGKGAVRLGDGSGGERWVRTSGNHHTVIWEEATPNGAGVRWVDEPATLLECYRRRACGEPVVQREGGPGRRFVFSLAAGEFVEVDDPDAQGRRAVMRVLSVSRGDMEFCRHADARTAEERKKASARVRMGAEGLRKANAVKVHVTHLGEVRRAGG